LASVIDRGKRNVLGVLVDECDYETAVARVIAAAQRRQPFGVAALAVHGVMTGVDNPAHRHRLNALELVTADGQAVRWAVNLLYGNGMRERVCGPQLTLEVCAAAAAHGLPVYLYGSCTETLDRLVPRLVDQFPALRVVGAEPSKFGMTTVAGKQEIVNRIRRSGARITFVGLGCPRQEVFAYEYRDALCMPVLAVGAAFDFHAGLLKRPGPMVQRLGLEWVYRIVQEPRRLAGRYTRTNPRFLARLGAQRLGLWRPDPVATDLPSAEELYA
jgi:N-acetylglucosaminyldiphosphoundecaprenol N-acetyl-beta-D-mannosaminyltransferase